jgi:hypothetical protein
MSFLNFRFLPAALLAAGLLFSTAVQAQAIKPEVAKPLKEAADLMRAGKGKEALAKARQADAVGGKTPAEQLLVTRTLGSAALYAGEYDAASKAFESVIDKVPAGDKAKIAEALAGAEYRAGRYAKAVQWAKQAGDSPAMQQLLVGAAFQTGDYATVTRILSANIAADEKAGRRPTDTELQTLASAYQRQNNTAGYANAIEKLLAYYPKKEYWTDILARLPRKPGFSDRFALDVYRLQLATGNMTKASDYMEAAQLALQAGYATEGRGIVEKGFATNVLGTGPEADRHKRLRDLALKQEGEMKAALDKEVAEAQAAKDGNNLVKWGYAYVTLGQADKGVELIEKGIAKGGLKRPEDAKLRLAQAQLAAGKKAMAQQTFRSVQGDDGAADIARLQVILASQKNLS